MPLPEPLQNLSIKTADRGFYDGFARAVAVPSKVIVGSLIFWAVFFSEQAGKILNEFNSFILTNFAHWYLWLIASFVATSLTLALWPAAGKLKLGTAEDKPEFSYFSWFSMMFGAGIGVGMLTWAVAEPIYHFGNSPEVIQGLADPNSAENVRNAFKWSFLHWGVGTWACYTLVGLAMAYFSYRRKLPLTVRSSLVPLFGQRLSGPLGHVFDVVAVVATILGAGQALGYGVEQFVAGMHRIGFGDWLLNAEGTASSMAIIFAVLVILAATILSALSGVGKGIKWLSNLNMGLSIILLVFFLLMGSTLVGLNNLFTGIFDYISQFLPLTLNVWSSNGGEVEKQLSSWQSSWTVFYFAWCVAFAPFVGMFLARISKGRTLREFVLGSMIMPSLMTFIWFAFIGGTAVDLELTGVAQGAIQSAPDGDKIFAMIEVLLSSGLAWVMAVLIVVLLLTYLVTTADSAVLVINTISAAGKEGEKARAHIVVWGCALGGMVGVLLLAGGLKAIQTAMVIGALPFSVVMVLMGISVTKAIYRDIGRSKAE